MSDHKRAKVYALDKVGPINVGAGNNDYICKAFGRTVEGHDVVVQITVDNFESQAKALLSGQAAEVLCDPSKILSFKLNVSATPDGVRAAIDSTRAKTLAGRQEEPDRRQPGT